MLQLKKGSFFIRVKGKPCDYLEKKEGYIFQYGGMLFGADYRKRKWAVTELTTGLRIDNTYIKYKNEIEEYMKQRIERIEELSKTDTAEGWRRMFRELEEREN